jgi:exonuclease III
MTNLVLKIGSLNLCLGLLNKKNILRKFITDHKNDILLFQETKVEINLHHDLLGFPGYNYESEINAVRSRVYIN